MSRFTRWLRSFFWREEKQSQADDLDKLLDDLREKWTAAEFNIESVIPVKHRRRRKSKVKAVASPRRKKSKTKSLARRRG